jgi:hypothetical protein
MQLRLKRGNSSYTFHLNVSVSDANIPGLPKEYFHWVGVQFTAEASTVHGTVNAYWPLVAARDTKYRHPRRRTSIAPQDIQGMIEGHCPCDAGGTRAGESDRASPAGQVQ